MALILGCSSGCTDLSARADDLSAASYTGTSLAVDSTRAIAHTIRIKVVADASHRREQIRWKAQARETIAAASDELYTRFGVVLEVVAIESWDDDGANRPLEEVLGALANEHPVMPGREDRVIAFTSSLNTPASLLHDLGMAYSHGEHLVLRGMQDHAELKFIKAALPRHERHLGEHIYHARIAHKRTTVLLHELGHTYGALHTRDDDRIMSPRYHHKTTAFSAANTVLLERAFALDALHTAEPHSTWQRAILDEVATMVEAKDPLLDQIPRAELDELLATQRALLSSFDLLAVTRALDARDPGTAWERLAPALKEEEPSADVAHLACFTQTALAQLDRLSLEQLERWCRRSLDLSANTSPAQVASAAHALAAAALHAEEPLRAFPLVKRVEEALRELEGLPSDRWLSLAFLYAGCGALSHAERVVALAGMTREASDLDAAIGHARQRYSLFDIDPDQEAALHLLLGHLATSLFAQDVDASRRLLEQLESLAPDSAPTIVARCQVANIANVPDVMQRACEEAVSRVPHGSMSHYGLAISHFVHAKNDEAIASLQRAIEIDPMLDLAWRLLARHYQQQGDEEALESLRRAYSDQHQSDPPW